MQSVEVSEKLLQRVKLEIEQSQLSQSAVAKKCGMTRQQLTNILNGHSTPSIGKLIDVLAGLELSVELKIKKNRSL